MKVCPKCGTQYGDDANFCTGDAGRLISVAGSLGASGTSTSTTRSASGGGADPGLVGGRFELGERVGGGSTGDVHKAIDRQDGQPVAVKLIASALTSQATTAQRIERELKLLERVASPAVARVIASGKQGDRMWVATEWVGNATPLDAALDAGAVLPAKASEIALAVGGALVEAAKVGVVHRDLAPKNILVGSDGVKVINFPLPVPGARVAGVPGFVSPEAIEGKPIDQRSATYSLGAIYYAALTGAAPFAGEAEQIHAAQLGGVVPPPSSKVPLAPEIDALVGRAMERNPAKRYLTLKQFLDDIDKVGKASSWVEPSPSTTQPFGRVGKPKELAATMLGLGAIPGGQAETELKTRVMDVEIPAEALREAAALYDEPAPAVVAAPAPAYVAAPAPAYVAAPAPVYVEPPVPVYVAPPAPVYVAPPVPVYVAPAPAPGFVVPEPVAPLAQAFAPQPTPLASPVASGSPWAPPTIAPSAAPGSMTPAVQAVEAAAPALGAIASAPARSTSASIPPTSDGGAGRSLTKANPGGKNKLDNRSKKKGQFRETLWFKKGDLDAAAAEEAARSQDPTQQDKADSMPMEERYSDDGTITRSDAERYSLKTGQTSQMPVFPAGQLAGASVSEQDLVGEMKSGRKIIFILIGVGVLVLIGVIALFAR